jgi:acyl-CoA reductase-like NAD-dependent aldehyde dehydrogenase
VTDADQGFNPYSGEPVGAPVPHSTPSEVDSAARAAAAAAPVLADLPIAARAGLLRTVAAALEAERDTLVPLADAETGLGTGRLSGELTRTTVQLEMFADVVADGTVLEAIIDPADPRARPVPRPDLRRLLTPIGPVAVFAASNFPFAFSVAGGDTASALAAGCPVVVKAHPGHPGLSVHCGRIVAGAVGIPGAFAVVHGLDAGKRLVAHPAIRAAGFTGSLAGGRALFDLAAGRPDPIPFYGELGSLNPTVLTPAAVAARGPELAQAFVASMTLGAGQFCTKPGLLFLPAGHGLAGPLTEALDAATLGPLLNSRLRDGYQRTAAELAAVPGVQPIVAPSTVDGESGWRAAPALLRVTAEDLVAKSEQLLTECFGPAALVIEYASVPDLYAALDALPGSLTATVHAEPSADAELAGDLLARLAARAGRVIFGGWPTGVAVSWAQQHGGPWPATTAPLHTSVGMTAARRFQRPVAYQGVPDALLPEPLRDANPLGILRRVNGRLTTDPI